MGISQFDEKRPVTVAAVYTIAQVGDPVKVTPDTPLVDRRVDTLILNTDSTTDALFALCIAPTDAADPLVGSVLYATVPAGSGMGTVAPVDFLTLALPASQSGIILPAGYSLYLQLQSGMSVGSTVFVLLSGGEL